MKAVAIFAIGLSGLLLAFASARASEPPSLQLDLGQASDLKVDASNVPLEQFLKTLGQQLNFTVDFSPLADRSAGVSGKFEGSLDEILFDVLRDTNYVERQGPEGVMRLVIIATAHPAAAPGGPPNTALKINVKSPAAQAAAGAPAASAVPGAAQSALAPTQASNPNNGPPGVVSKLVSTQASTLLPTSANTSEGAPPGATQSLGVLTHVAQANVQALVSALNTACFGQSCAH
jgi:hypothetical protein